MYEIKINYEIFMNGLSALSPVIEDSLTDKGARNILIECDKVTGAVALIGSNQNLFMRVDLDLEGACCKGDANVFNGLGDETETHYIVQLSNKEVVNFLSTYKNLELTKAEAVSLKIYANRQVLIEVQETTKLNKNSSAECLSYEGKWHTHSKAVNRHLLSRVQHKEPDTFEFIDGKKLHDKLELVAPLLIEGRTLYSQVLFAEKLVVFTRRFVAIADNTLSRDYFSGYYLTHRGVKFLEDYTNKHETIQCAKDDTYLYFKSDNTTAFVLYYTDSLKTYKHYESVRQIEKGYSCSRIYLREVLKRFLLDGEDMTVVVNNDNMEIVTHRFEQKVPLKGNTVEGVGYLLSPELLNQMILGDDKKAGDTCHFYCDSAPQGGVMLTIENSQHTWFCMARVEEKGD